MKKVLVAFLLILLCFILTACSNNYEKEIEGYWNETEMRINEENENYKTIKADSKTLNARNALNDMLSSSNGLLSSSFIKIQDYYYSGKYESTSSGLGNSTKTNGTYKIQGNKITISTPDGTNTYLLRINGDMMTLEDEKTGLITVFKR